MSERTRDDVLQEFLELVAKHGPPDSMNEYDNRQFYTLLSVLQGNRDPDELGGGEDEQDEGELKPCPFCGGEAQVVPDYPHMGEYTVVCSDCKAKGPVFHKRAEVARKHWNTREADNDNR